MEASPGEALVGRQIEHFLVEQLIGAGGMAYVYRARDLVLGRIVALKALSLSPLHLTSSGGMQCSGSQTITNSGAQSNTWVWASIAPSPHSSFVFGVNAPAQFGGFPGDLSPGIPPGGTDVLNIRMKCTGLTYTVTLRDGFGRIQQFTWTSD